MDRKNWNVCPCGDEWMVISNFHPHGSVVATRRGAKGKESAENFADELELNGYNAVEGMGGWYRPLKMQGSVYDGEAKDGQQ